MHLLPKSTDTSSLHGSDGSEVSAAAAIAVGSSASVESTEELTFAEQLALAQRQEEEVQAAARMAEFDRANGVGQDADGAHDEAAAAAAAAATVAAHEAAAAAAAAGVAAELELAAAEAQPPYTLARYFELHPSAIAPPLALPFHPPVTYLGTASLPSPSRSIEFAGNPLPLLSAPLCFPCCLHLN